MESQEHFWRLENLSDRQLLERLQSVLRTQRCTLAEIVAHLGEVEERRLHLAAAYGSMFSYCVQHLRMSEDEACRRIELARLARKFPVLFGELASGRISLSVALLLKPVLTPGNHAELVAAVRGASLRTARELLAARFPSPDAPSRIRKLPEPLVAHASPTAVHQVANAIPVAADEVANTTPAAVHEVANASSATASDVMPARVATPGGTTDTTTALADTSSPQPPLASESAPGARAVLGAQSSFQAPPTSAELSPAPAPTALPHPADPRPHQRIEPLSVERYRIVFTADASLKQKLELARNLLRHSHPSGDFALIISRALDLLLEDLLQRRFGARRKDAPQRARGARSRAAEEAAAPSTSAPTAAPTTSAPAAAPTTSAPAAAPTTATPTAAPTTATPTAAPTTSAPAAAPTGSASPIATPRSTPPVALPVTVPSPTRPLATRSVTTASVVARTTPTSRIARPARRAVLERDGLGCCWVDAEGHRCGSTAWLEHDHRHPAGQGGSSKPENLRQLCRAHNRFAAERAYGRDHIERAIQTRQRNRRRGPQNGQPPSSSPPA